MVDKIQLSRVPKEKNVSGQYALNVCDYLQNKGKNDETFNKEWEMILKVSKLGFIR